MTALVLGKRCAGCGLEARHQRPPPTNHSPPPPPLAPPVRPFTLFAPTDAAVTGAYAGGSFDYPELFARNKSELAGVVAYHAVPQVAHTLPGPITARMETLLSQGQGGARCANPTLSWRPDGFVYGGAGAGKVGATYDRGCAATIFQVGVAQWGGSTRDICCRAACGLLADGE